MKSLKSLRELLRIAFRNLSRHKVKSTLSILAVAVSVTTYIFVDGWVVGMRIDSERNIVSYETGAAKLQTKAYFENLDDKPMYESFDGWEPCAEALSKAGYASAPRFVFSGTLYSPTGSAPVEFYGIDPALDPKVLRVDTAVDAGRFIQSGNYEIVLGNMTADKLQTGLPLRPTKEEFENEILPLVPDTEQDFVRGLYTGGAERYYLRRDAKRSDLDRYWDLLAATGRMDLRISTVIDMKDPDGKTDAYGKLVIRHVYQVIDVTLAGTVNAPDPQLNNNTAFIPLDILQGDTGLMLDGKVTELVIRKHNANDVAVPGNDESAQAISSALNKELAADSAAASDPSASADGGALPSTLGVFGWQGYVKDFIAASAGDNWSMRIMTFILFVLSFLGIANTMLLAILERTKEIGMMRAQGMTDGQLLFALMAEAGFVGLIGAAAGVAAGCLINIPMVSHGIDMTAMTETMGGDIGYRVNGVFRSAWNVPVIAGTGIVASIIAALTAYFPARRALKMPVTESLRFE